MTRICGCINCIVPPHLLQKLLESKDKEIRAAALNTLLSTAHLRGQRASLGALAFAFASPANGRRTIFDCRGSARLDRSHLVRSEDAGPVKDQSVNRAYDGLGSTREFYKEVFARNSIDGQGMRLDGFVHHRVAFNNAFWDGKEMVFGDGDGVIFTDFTKSLDVIGHELTHGVTEFSAGLEYHNQSGALNESISDVFGSLVKQWSLKQTAAEADWLIGAEVFTPDIGGDALRSLRNPGSAYDNDTLGRDPQPDHMDRYVALPDTDVGDNGGVHINSGIPNKAFYLTATGIGGFAWEAPGHIWYESLKASSPTTEFQDFAETTFMKADQLYGTGSHEQQAVAAAWQAVGIRAGEASSGLAGRALRAASPSTGREAAGLLALNQKIDELSQQVKTLAKEVSAGKNKPKP